MRSGPPARTDQPLLHRRRSELDQALGCIDRALGLLAALGPKAFHDALLLEKAEVLVERAEAEAPVRYELWRITRDDGHRSAALMLCQDLYRDSPVHDHRLRLEALGADGVAAGGEVRKST